jgi:hypothetical protein
LELNFEFLTGYEWGRAPESPCVACAEEESEEGAVRRARKLAADMKKMMMRA